MKTTIGHCIFGAILLPLLASTTFLVTFLIGSFARLEWMVITPGDWVLFRGTIGVVMVVGFVIGFTIKD